MSSSTESLSSARQPPGFVGMRLLLRYLSPRLPLVSLLALALLGGIAVQLTNPQIIRSFIDTAQSRGPQRALLSAAAWYIGLSLAGQALTLVASTLAESLSWASTNDLRRDLALHCLQLDLSFHNRHTPGELLERIDGDTTALANFLSSFVIQVIGNGVLLAGILALLFREDLRVGLSLTLFTLAALLLLGAIQRLAVGRWASERQASANLFGYLEERIAAAEDLRASGAEGYALRRLDGLARILVSKSRSAFVVSSLVSSLTDLLFALGYAAALALGAYLYTQGRFSLGAAYLVVTYVGMLAEPLQRIRLQWQDYQQAVASIQRIQELMAIQPRVRDATGANIYLVENHAVPQVEFNRVSFRYNDQNPADEGCAPDVLSEVNFTLRSGQVLGILGRTGSGKTTLTRLLFRLYDPTQGQVCLDGTDLRQMSRTSLHHQVGMVTQEVQIFQASLRDNIAFFNPRITASRNCARSISRR
ncbi:MAG TPA: ABC transporter ATP-binding protein [Anaerolineales bacterium]